MSLDGPTETIETETDHAKAKRATDATPRPCAYEQCQKPFTPARADARFCSPSCRLKAHRAAKAQDTTAEPAPEPAPSTKPRKPRPGGHKPDGAARYQEARREALADIANRLQPKRQKTPVPYSDEIADIIIERLEQGEALHAICSTDDMPSHAAVHKWAAEMPSIFGDRYVRARELGYLKLADELDALAAGLDVGERRFESGVVARHRLQVEQRRWTLSKMLPKVFGDKLDVTSAGKPLASASDLDIAKALAHALAPALPAPEPIEVEAVPVEAEGEQP
jgi:hypothetical protein